MQFECDDLRLNSECRLFILLKEIDYFSPRYIAMYSYVRNVEFSSMWLYYSLVFAQNVSLLVLVLVANLSLRILWNVWSIRGIVEHKFALQSSKFHPNMMRLIILFVAHANVQCFASFTIMLFQADLLDFSSRFIFSSSFNDSFPFQDSDSFGHKFLLFASEIRLYTLYLFLNMFIASVSLHLFNYNLYSIMFYRCFNDYLLPYS